jgi:osmoprotectant transport system permease protein
MTDLNYKVDYLKESPDKVAKDFLVKQALWREPRTGTKGVIRIGSKIFAEQYTLSSMYAMLIRGYTDLGVETKTGLGGTKICFDALTNSRIDLYPEYTGTGLLVILKPSSEQVDALIADKDRVYNYVKRHFEDQYNVSWLKPVGFNNAYALMMRRNQSDQLHVKSISDLALFLEKNR